VVALLRKLGFDPAAMPWRSGVVASKPARTFTPYPPLKERSQKTVVARELLGLEWPVGSPDDLSALAMATKLTNKYKSRIAARTDGRGRSMTKITEDDIKRALGRK
jgi:hypothetical protein